MREAENSTMRDYYAHEKEEDEKYEKLLGPLEWPEDQRRRKLACRICPLGWRGLPAMRQAGKGIMMERIPRFFIASEKFLWRTI